MKAILSRDFVGGVAAIVIAAIYLNTAYGLRVSALDDIFGPGGMPKAYGWTMMFLGVALCVVTVVTRWRDDMRGEWAGQGRRVLWAAGLLGIAIVYLMIVNSVGYLVSMVLLIAATMIYHGERPSARVLGTALFGGAILWAIFVFVLGVSMPSGILSFIGI